MKPEMLITIAIQAAGTVFSAGVLFATVRFLTKRVDGHDARLDAHDDKLEKHGEEIAALNTKAGLAR